MYYGFRKGFIDSFIEISIWLGSFLLALFLSEHTVRLFQFLNISGIWVRPAYFIVLLVGFSRLIFVSCDKLSSKISDEIHLHWSNKLLGVIPGLLSGIIYTSLLSFFFLSHSVGSFTEKTKQSNVARVLTRQTEWPGKEISKLFNNIGYKLGSSFTIHPKGMELVPLPFRTSDYRIRNDLEIRMLELINNERKKAGIKSMVFDTELASVARKHSADMVERGYFSHYTPEGKSPFDRMRIAKVKFVTAGENLALAQTLQLAHEGLMESPVHKANILHRSFTRAGIGVLDAGIHGIIITQNFRN